MLAFKLMASSAASVQSLLVEAHRGYPYKLASATLGEEEQANVCADPECVRDPISNAIVKHFNGDLNSDDAQAVVLALAELVRPDIARIECRHASVRRSVYARSCQTRAKYPLSLASADFVMMRHRMWDAFVSCHTQRARQVSKSRLHKLARKTKAADQDLGGNRVRKPS